MATALLVIDVQKIYTDPDSEYCCDDCEGTIKMINRLVDDAESRGFPVFLIRHVHKADGSDIGRLFDYAGDVAEDFDFKEGTDAALYDERLIRPKGAKEIVKNRYSAFVGTALDKQLRKECVDRVIVCGFMTNFCCESTARNALDLDYYVDFVIDATGTPGTENMDQKQVRKVVAELLESGFARVMTTKDFLKG